MASKVLTYNSCEHFYRLRDALGDYAYQKLDIGDELYIGKGKPYSNENMYYESTLADTLDELWQTPELLDEFIKDNPASFSTKDLKVIENWRSSLSGWFTVFKDKGRLVFLRDNKLFEVTGLYEEIENVLKSSDFPMLVQTTLLPFENKVVYHGFLSHMPITMGEGMRDMIEKEIEEALQLPVVINTADKFIRDAAKIKEKEEKERAEREEHERVLEEESEKQMEGFHKGALVGLSGQEREDAVDAELEKNVRLGLVKSMIADLKERTVKGQVTRDLQKLISNEPKARLKRWALVLGVEAQGKGNKADLIHALLPELSSNAFLPELTLRAGLSTSQFEAYRKLYEMGGMMEVPEREITSLVGLPATTSLICYAFYTKGSSKSGGQFTFVIPNEIMDVLDEMDWDEIHEGLVNRDAAAHIADAAVELRGIAKADEVYDEYCRFHPAALDRDEFEEAVIDAMVEDSIGCTWLKADDGDDYLLHYEIAAFYNGEIEKARIEDAEGLEDAGEYRPMDYAVIKGPLAPLEFILEERKEKHARPLEDNMLSSRDVYEWKTERPAVLALRAYLDEHVPDTQNDYYYAESVIDDLIDYMTFGIMDGSKFVSNMMGILEEHDYVPNEAHLSRVLGLLMNMYNSLPTWMNNGWAPNELADIKLGRKSFYNEDGSRMKVGRNDPCPCGSGRKYKNCCGRNYD